MSLYIVENTDEKEDLLERMGAAVDAEDKVVDNILG
jgi:hypothetical protein